MSSRATNGRSTIFKGADGRWHGYVSMGVTPDGKKVVRRHVSGKTRSVVTTKVERLEAQRAATSRRSASTGATLTGHWMDEWLKITERRRKPSTYASHESLIRVHAGPLRGIKLANVSVSDIDDVLALCEANSTAYRAKNLHRTLRACFGEAVRRGLIPANPCKYAVVPRAEDSEVHPYNMAETRAILAAAADTPNGVRYVIAVVMGLRQGEALGLRLSDIDLDDNLIRIRQQYQRLRHKHGCGQTAPNHKASHCPNKHGGGWVFQSLKTRNGLRDIPIPEPIVPMLRAHIRDLRKARLAAGAVWQDHDLVFPRADGLPIHPTVDSKGWHALTAKAGVRRLRLHDARHTAATMMLAIGVDGRITMSLLGWGSASLLGRYQHALSEITRPAMTKLGDAVFPAPVETNDGAL